MTRLERLRLWVNTDTPAYHLFWQRLGAMVGFTLVIAAAVSVAAYISYPFSWTLAISLTAGSYWAGSKSGEERVTELDREGIVALRVRVEDNDRLQAENKVLREHARNYKELLDGLFKRGEFNPDEDASQ